MPISNNSSAFSTSAPASTTTDVVPSPTALSTALDASIITFAAGCSTSIFLRNVAPSLVTVISPRISINIFSSPLGPRKPLTRSAINLAARRLYLRASVPYVLLTPSLNSCIFLSMENLT